MPRILGIDTSNYTTSVSVVEDGKILYDARKILNVRKGERGLRQSEALFQHVINLPSLLKDERVKGLDGVCTSIRPRPIEGSYMPVFKAGESIGISIASAMGIPFFETSHQESHIEAACQSIGFDYDEFYAFHLSGGTSELLKVKRKDGYKIQIIGGTKDISTGQFLDRLGVAMGLSFPAGKFMDQMAMEAEKTGLRIPSRVDGLYFNLSGQETMGLKFIENGYNYEEVAFAAMMCVSKTLEKIFKNLFIREQLPLILIGGVASSGFLRKYLNTKFKDNIFFSKAHYAVDNAVGTAFIGWKKLKGGFYER